ncbi:polysulfide reductase NrfD [candidate division KSB1 bacterium]|nr:polysulfide reductase NrfD [candidate division KSB1 bacterium]
MEHLFERLTDAIQHATGYIYPNEAELHWNILIVIYPYITGLVAGAFILASLERVFNVKELQPTYRLSLLTALSFLLIAVVPLQVHLAHPERGYEMFTTPNPQSAMAMFGFVYLWYLMAVLLLEIWLDFRKDIIQWANESKGLKRLFYLVLTLGSKDVSEKAIEFDHKFGKLITIIGIPSAFLLHGYVGFIFGSVKANPWWSSVLMPIVFLFSAIVSGLALMLLVYMVSNWVRRKQNAMDCLDKLSSYLLYMLIIDFSLEALDFVHRLYESEESIHILSQLIGSKLFTSFFVLQLLVGTLIPFTFLTLTKLVRIGDTARKVLYFASGILIQIGIMSIRWNVVIGGQLFSKSLRGLTVYKIELFGMDGLFLPIAILIAPIFILIVVVKLLPPWPEAELSK